jgi:hypothetical protein
MKTIMKIKGTWLMAGLLILSNSLFAIQGEKEQFADTAQFNAYYGKVTDAVSGRAKHLAATSQLFQTLTATLP